MHESHPGVQDMAAETFLKIAKLTKHMFLRTDVEAVHSGQAQQEPYVCVLIRGLPEHLRDLEMHQKL